MRRGGVPAAKDHFGGPRPLGAHARRPQLRQPSPEALLKTLDKFATLGTDYAERVLPVLGFDLRGIEVRLHAVRQDSPPKLLSIDYLITVDTDEPDHRIELLHTNIRKYGTISNTLALAVPIAGRIVRKA